MMEKAFSNSASVETTTWNQYIPEETIREWQGIVELIVRLSNARLGLVMRVIDDSIQVYVSSKTENNPYHVGDSAHLIGSGLYCERVIATQKPLLVPNALQSVEWSNNPDIEFNMISYLGVPIQWPNGKPFGTICVLDDKEHAYSSDLLALLEQMRNLIEHHLRLKQARDVAEAAVRALQSANSELNELATTDSLTGIANRGHFYQQANLHFQQAERYGEALSLLALDIDHFKSINDTHGHQAGDSALRGLAEHFRQGIRAFDLMGRIGGEEFAILLPNTDLDGAVELAERLRETLTERRLKVDGETELAVTVSIGAASRLPTDASLDRLFARADQALYRAKEAGRNRVATIEERVPGKMASIIRLMWKVGYDCGHPVIDSEHRELFRLANELLDLASVEVSPQAIQAALDALLAHVVGHFAHEEAILRRHDYAEVEHHAELHQRLVERAFVLREQADKEGIAFGDLVQFLAQEVVARHMLLADRKFYGLFAKPNAP